MCSLAVKPFLRQREVKGEKEGLVGNILEVEVFGPHLGQSGPPLRVFSFPYRWLIVKDKGHSSADQLPFSEISEFFGIIHFVGKHRHSHFLPNHHLLQWLPLCPHVQF